MPNCRRRPILLGLCAMAKKTNSKPMTAILTRLRRFAHIQVVIFDEATVLGEAVEAWPQVDALISFYSHGFPLEKVASYAQLRRPFLVNDLDSQSLLMDRRKVYQRLRERDIPVVRHAVCYRGGQRDDDDSANLVEAEDHIVVDGVTFNKPFVEKPLDADDHRIHIYFPSSAGGGSVRLFRKVGNCSSRYHSHSRVRRQGSYIYEDFMVTDGTDIKVYAIGPDYAHAEARKSPALDGKVERDPEGKEMRCPVILTAREKVIAKKVVEAFSQTVCGFDLLRANGVSYVCDVNGFSFVKSSSKYYDDCAFMLGVMVTSAIAPSLSLSINYPKIFGYVDIKTLLPVKPLALQHLFSTSLIRSNHSDPQLQQLPSDTCWDDRQHELCQNQLPGLHPKHQEMLLHSSSSTPGTSSQLILEAPLPMAGVSSSHDSSLADDESEESGQARLDTAPCVPEIYPLETLHNSLTLRQLELFLHRFTRVKLQTPWSSRRHSLKSEN